ncbi:hypothetical protein AX774_g6898 [Zancudomyces culisetae]|uniref:Actin interacting protein 3 C-terminal domain-containing protein n=1 Tax=Zancudomyces culisetae TaxID=1213189 RepID=A0A1R1PFJ6_ZANCU|nr:hypothetical protein AX774_g6898 [Zancudomyces culisetae]|eukprot:OMH79683.1 hypothetical protein AX774_g6898 [Zancudomyces culisetae]
MQYQRGMCREYQGMGTGIQNNISTKKAHRNSIGGNMEAYLTKGRRQEFPTTENGLVIRERGSSEKYINRSKDKGDQETQKALYRSGSTPESGTFTITPTGSADSYDYESNVVSGIKDYRGILFGNNIIQKSPSGGSVNECDTEGSLVDLPNSLGEGLIVKAIDIPSQLNRNKVENQRRSRLSSEKVIDEGTEEEKSVLRNEEKEKNEKVTELSEKIEEVEERRSEETAFAFDEYKQQSDIYSENQEKEKKEEEEQMGGTEFMITDKKMTPFSCTFKGLEIYEDLKNVQEKEQLVQEQEKEEKEKEKEKEEKEKDALSNEEEIPMAKEKVDNADNVNIFELDGFSLTQSSVTKNEHEGNEMHKAECVKKEAVPEEECGLLKARLVVGTPKLKPLRRRSQLHNVEKKADVKIGYEQVVAEEEGEGECEGEEGEREKEREKEESSEESKSGSDEKMNRRDEVDISSANSMTNSRESITRISSESVKGLSRGISVMSLADTENPKVKANVVLAAQKKRKDRKSISLEASGNSTVINNLFLVYNNRVKKATFIGYPSRIGIANLFRDKYINELKNISITNESVPAFLLKSESAGIYYELEDYSELRENSIVKWPIKESVAISKEQRGSHVVELEKTFDQISDQLSNLNSSLTNSVACLLDEKLSSIITIDDLKREINAENAIKRIQPEINTQRLLNEKLEAVQSQLEDRENTIAELRKKMTEVESSKENEIVRLRKQLETSNKLVAEKQAQVDKLQASISAQKLENTQQIQSNPRAEIEAEMITLKNEYNELCKKMEDTEALLCEMQKDVVKRGSIPTPQMIKTIKSYISFTKTHSEFLSQKTAQSNKEWKNIWESELKNVVAEQTFVSKVERGLKELVQDSQSFEQIVFNLESVINLRNERQKSGKSLSKSEEILLKIGFNSDCVVTGLGHDHDDIVHDIKRHLLDEIKSVAIDSESRMDAIINAQKVRQIELDSRPPNILEQQLSEYLCEKPNGSISSAVHQLETSLTEKNNHVLREMMESTKISMNSANPTNKNTRSRRPKKTI